MTSTPHKNWTLLAVCLGTFMLLIDITIVVVALPQIRGSLHTSFSDVQWMVDAYSLSLAALLLPTGSLADIFGRRTVFAAGLGIFTLGSLLCGVAGSGTELIIWRVLQGIGGATVFATSLALLAQTFHGRERGVAFGAWGAVAAASTALGPLLGGILTTELSWHWIFIVNVPIGAFAILITLTKVAEFRPPQHRQVDVAGFLVFTLGLTALVYGLIDSGLDGWGATKVQVALVIAAGLLVAFPLVELLVRQPMFNLALFRKPTFLGGSIAAFAMNGSLFAMFLYIVLYFQNADHFSALGCGWRLAIITAGSLLTAIPAGRLSAHMPVRFLIGPGLGLVGAGLLLMRGLGAGTDWTHLIPGFVVAGLGSGMVNAPLASTAVGVVAPQDSGMASGINTTFRQVGIATSVAALGSIFASKLKSATPATVSVHYASAVSELCLITALLAFAGGACALVLIRPRDFHVHAPDRPTPEGEAGSPVPVGAGH
ncbi:MAG: MFS transporter [Solirubrobacterales bacterium]|nr:MFS transporter [Solirubrobacterales bacterium]